MTALDELARTATDALAGVPVDPDPEPLAPRMRRRMRTARRVRGGVAAAGGACLVIAIAAMVGPADRSRPSDLVTNGVVSASVPTTAPPSTFDATTIAGEPTSTVAPTSTSPATTPTTGEPTVSSELPSAVEPLPSDDDPDSPTTATTFAPPAGGVAMSVQEARDLWRAGGPSRYEWRIVFRFPALPACDAESIVTMLDGERTVEVLRDPPVECPAGGFAYSTDVAGFLESADRVLVPYTGTFDAALGVPLLVTGGTCTGDERCVTVLETLSFRPL